MQVLNCCYLGFECFSETSNFSHARNFDLFIWDFGPFYPSPLACNNVKSLLLHKFMYCARIWVTPPTLSQSGLCVLNQCPHDRAPIVCRANMGVLVF